MEWEGEGRGALSMLPPPLLLLLLKLIFEVCSEFDEEGDALGATGAGAARRTLVAATETAGSVWEEFPQATGGGGGGEVAGREGHVESPI